MYTTIATAHFLCHYNHLFHRYHTHLPPPTTPSKQNFNPFAFATTTPPSTHLSSTFSSFSLASPS
ncbi:hypothetical protein Hanom_Chr00s085762g01796511 [Helianthus anomalus]